MSFTKDFRWALGLHLFVMGIVLHALAAAGYVALAIMAWRALRLAPEAPAGRHEQIGLAAVLLVQALALLDGMFSDGSLRIGFALMLSAAMFLGMIVYWVESLLIRVDGLRLLLLPLAAVVALLPIVFPQSRIIANPDSEWLRLHLSIALAAYSMMTIAALHALLMAAADRRLHDLSAPPPRDTNGFRQTLARMFDAMPPLLVLERLLFRLIWIGFVLLTLTVVTGIGFSEEVFGRALRMDHKTVFTLLSWLTFGLLLIGRQVRGWRGRLALRWTLAGFALLLLAYVGSRFMLEVVLHRG